MVKPKLFTVSLQVANDTYTAKGKTVVEALDKINPPHIKARGIFVVSYDGKQSQRMMLPAQIKQLLMSKVFKQIFEKRATITLK